MDSSTRAPPVPEPPAGPALPDALPPGPVWACESDAATLRFNCSIAVATESVSVFSTFFSMRSIAESIIFERSKVFFFRDFFDFIFLGAKDTALGGFLTAGIGLGFATFTAGFWGGFFSAGFGFTTEAAGPPESGPLDGRDTRLTFTTPDRNLAPEPNSGIKTKAPIITR